LLETCVVADIVKDLCCCRHC